MRRLAVFLAPAIFPALMLAAPAGAQTTDDAAQSQPAIEGSALGEHVSGHAPEHPREMGVLFGDCVAELALTGTCPHEDTDEHDG